ncbi:MAG: arginase [Cyanobacteria bacterium SZAS TMP-1]|nr:arginase [Cyanobacteria bacterium SZAS TMP-1]
MSQTKSSASNVATKTALRESKVMERARAVTLIYCPIHLGGPHAGASMGPAAMKVASVVSKIQKLGFRIEREVDIPVPNALCWWEESNNQARCVPEIGEVSLAVAQAVEEALEAGTIPITLGGDHSLAIGSIAGASNYYRKKKEEFGVVWFDAHGDINTPESSHSGNVHGMPFAVSLGDGDERLTKLLGFSPKLKASRCALIGIRDLDADEIQLIAKSGIAPFTMRDVDDMGMAGIIREALMRIKSDDKNSSPLKGLHVSFDLDVIDPDVAPGVSTESRGGLTYRESHYALELLADTGLVTSIDIVELNPARDIRNQTAELAVDLVQSALGKNIL